MLTNTLNLIDPVTYNLFQIITDTKTTTYSIINIVSQFGFHFIPYLLWIFIERISKVLIIQDR